MSDPRLTAANARVADAALRGQVTAPRYTDGTPRRVTAPLTDLRRAPAGPRDRQLLMGAPVTVFEDHAGWSFIRAQADGYVGYVATGALGTVPAPTHRVATRATHAYTQADMKSAEVMMLSLGTQVCVTGTEGAFAQTPLGFVPARHLAMLSAPESDPVTVAARFLGTPYLWGGNSACGIDCSGLIQIPLWACGQDCPGDSDLQQAALGQTLPPGTAPQRGDLMFWKGHVAWVADSGTFLHANAHAMAVCFEPLDAALSRIAQTDGPVTRHARLTYR